MSKSRLKIGISPRILHPVPKELGFRRKTLQYLEQSIAHWVMARDVLVFMVPTIEVDSIVKRSDMRLRDYVDELDGLVLQGGVDVSPISYGEAPRRDDWSGDRVRDQFEMELLNAFIEARKPVLGICRGMQLINVAFGGTLYQDIETMVPGAIPHTDEERYDQYTHGVKLMPGTRMASLYPGISTALINSLHHQSVKDLGRDLRVEAVSEPDGVIEAIRWTGPSYVFGVQWHPEFFKAAGVALLDGRPLLDEFLDAAAGAPQSTASVHELALGAERD